MLQILSTVYRLLIPLPTNMPLVGCIRLPSDTQVYIHTHIYIYACGEVKWVPNPEVYVVKTGLEPSLLTCVQCALLHPELRVKGSPIKDATVLKGIH